MAVTAARKSPELVTEITPVPYFVSHDRLNPEKNSALIHSPNVCALRGLDIAPTFL